MLTTIRVESVHSTQRMPGTYAIIDHIRASSSERDGHRTTRVKMTSRKNKLRGNVDDIFVQSEIRSGSVSSGESPVSGLPCAAASLRPPSVELDLVHRPDGALDILHPHEALVEREIVANCVLT